MRDEKCSVGALATQREGQVFTGSRTVGKVIERGQRRSRPRKCRMRGDILYGRTVHVDTAFISQSGKKSGAATRHSTIGNTTCEGRLESWKINCVAENPTESAPNALPVFMLRSYSAKLALATSTRMRCPAL